jgi:hypothetical protein
MTTGTSRVDRFERRTEWPLARVLGSLCVAYGAVILATTINLISGLGSRSGGH